MMFVLYMCDVCHLFTFAVDAFRSEQIDGLLYQVRAATAEHAEPQVLQKLCLSGCSIQLPWHTKTIICPAETNTKTMTCSADKTHRQPIPSCVSSENNHCFVYRYVSVAISLWPCVLQNVYWHNEVPNLSWTAPNLFPQKLLHMYLVYDFKMAFYFSCRGSQSIPGSMSRAACRTSSLSTEKLRRCSAWATATRIHSIRGGSTINGLQGETISRISIIHFPAPQHLQLLRL